MLSKTIIVSLFFLILSCNCFAQTNSYVYYFNADFGLCSKRESLFTGKGNIKNNLLNLRVYSNKFPENILLDANFTDTTLSVYQGMFQSFYLNGKKESEMNYDNNVLNGTWEKWDTSGHLIDSLHYAHGKVTDSTKFYYFTNGRISAYKFTDFTNDKLQVKYYNDSGKVTTEIFFTGQKGIRKNYTNGTVAFDSLFTREEKEASFPGGGKAWASYISRSMMGSLDRFTSNDYGTCIVKFIIETDGRVSDVEATTMKGTRLARAAVYAIKDGPKWIPAMQYGKLVRAYRLQPVTIQRPR